jgi:hypothetical protein
MALFAMFEYLIYPLIGFVGTLGTRSRMALYGMRYHLYVQGSKLGADGIIDKRRVCNMNIEKGSKKDETNSCEKRSS